MITYEEFSNIELKVGEIVSAESIEESEKLIKLRVDIGEEEPRQILAGIKNFYNPEDLIGKQITIIANLKPRMMMGMESQGMILAAGENAVLISPQQNVPNGTQLK